MIFPSLSDAERAVLEDLLLHGPNRNLPTPIRGRLSPGSRLIFFHFFPAASSAPGRRPGT